jgi:GTPase SAR1 family protein
MAESQEVPIKSGIELAKKLKATFQQTSAKTNEGVEELFKTLAEKLYLKHLAGESNVRLFI